MKKRKVKYIIYGKDDVILKESECFARYGENEIQDILDDADIYFDDIWSVEHTDL
jgi:hypothetical protein